MPTVHINFYAVIAAAVISFIIGAIWYSPGVFGSTWMALIGKRPEDMRSGAGQAYVGVFISALILAYVLARFISLAGAHTIGDGAQIGFWVWIGFVATTSVGGVLFAGMPPKLWSINNGFQLVSLVIIGAVLARWQ